VQGERTHPDIGLLTTGFNRSVADLFRLAQNWLCSLCVKERGGAFHLMYTPAMDENFLGGLKKSFLRVSASVSFDLCISSEG
jgi:hypothetical protein